MSSTCCFLLEPIKDTLGFSTVEKWRVTPKKRPQIWRSTIFGPIIFTKSNWVLASHVCQKTHEVTDRKDSVCYYKKCTPPENSRIFFWKKNDVWFRWFMSFSKWSFCLGDKKFVHFRCKVTLYFKNPGPQCCLRSHGWIIIGSSVFFLSEIYLKPTISQKQSP